MPAHRSGIRDCKPTERHHTATDNARSLIDELTRKLNASRQASITQELTEIIGSADALNKKEE